MQVEQTPPQRRVVPALVVALVVLVGGAGAAYLVRRHALAEERSLNTGTYPSGTSFSADIGQIVTYGDIIMANEGTKPISIQSAELLTDGSGADVEDVRLLDPDDVPKGSLVGTAHGYDPPAAAKHLPAVMEPTSPDRKKAYQLLYGIRVKTAAPGWFYSVRIRYKVGDNEYQQTAVYRLLLCTPKGIICPLPPRPTFN
jgi:hypothetical protein